jgi:hypothetical protein
VAAPFLRRNREIDLVGEEHRAHTVIRSNGEKGKRRCDFGCNFAFESRAGPHV